MAVHDQGRQVKDDSKVKQILSNILNDNLTDLAKRGLLLAVADEADLDEQLPMASSSVRVLSNVAETTTDNDPLLDGKLAINWQALV